MSLSSISRRTALFLVAVSSVFDVACSAESAAPTFAPTDIEADTATGSSAASTTRAAAISDACTTGETRACRIVLGEHGGIANCVDGLDVCSAGEWTGCLDSASLAENPELVSQLTAE